MAAPKKTAAPTKPAPEQPNTKVAHFAANFAADAGAGMEGADSDSFAIPFLNILQKGSPQVDEDSGAFVKGAKPGMLYENVTQRLIDGKEGALVIPCAYKRVFIKWGPRGGEGSGFQGEMSPEEAAAGRQAGKYQEVDGRLVVPMHDGTLDTKKCVRLADTRNHYVLVVDTKTGLSTQAVLSLTSTQIKKSKALMSMLANIKIDSPNGPVTPATFANVVKVTTVPESNDKGSWMGVKFELAGIVDRAQWYQAAKSFHGAVAKGRVNVRYDDLAEGETDAPAGGRGF